MPFSNLPEFPQGGVARAESGNQGIPPEAFQTALQDAGSSLLTSSKRPEDAPAVQAALGAEVDVLSQQLGFAPSPGQATPAQPDTSQGPAAPLSQPPTGDLRERIARVMEKYSSPEELAKAYVHTDAARTQAQQQRAQEIAALRNELADVRSLLSTQRYAPAPGQPAQAPGPSPSGSEDPEEFFKTPAQRIANIVEDVTNRVVTRHLTAYNEAQRQYMEAQQFDSARANLGKEIEELRPFMDELYLKHRAIYDGMPQVEALNLLVENARDRKEAYRARAYHQEISQILGGNGTPANAAPGQTGALPGGTAGRRVDANQPVANWSDTPAFNRLWKARSDSVDEMRAVTDILKERKFGEDVPIY